MKASKFLTISALFSFMVASSSGALANGSLEQCLADAENHYHSVVAQCYAPRWGSVFNDRTDAEWCEYGAGQEYYGAVEDCNRRYQTGSLDGQIYRKSEQRKAVG